MTDQDRNARLDRLLDRTEIYDLVRWERFCRDQRDWEGLLACYVPGSPVRTSWYDGDIAGFVDQSREKMEKKGSSGKHWIMPATHQVRGDRAIVESPAFIYDRLTFDGIEFDFHQYCRFFSRLTRTEDGWRLASFEGIYQRDNLQCTDPRNPLPVDWDIIKTLRPSYRFMGYTQLKRGYRLNPELIGDDRPDLVEAFYAGERRWLETGA